VVYKDDYQQPPENSLKKVPVLQIALPAPPRRASSASTSTSLKLTFKSLKPAATYSLAVHPTDTIAAVKEALAALPNGPAVPAQRLLFKGKALADGKLVKEYPISDGDTVNLSLKAVPVSTPPTTADKDIIMTDAPPPKLTLDPPAPTPGQPRRHTRIPSVVLSPSPSSESPPGGVLGESKDITLTLDTDEAMSMPTAELSTYHAALAEPEFWEKLLAFLGTSFSPTDAERAWEDFLRAAKNTLTASEVARIRDRVGVSGMAGT